MDSDNALDSRLARQESDLYQLKQAVRNLQLCRRQALLSEVGHLEKALGIKPTTAELRRRAKGVVASDREEQPPTEETAQCGPEETQEAQGSEGG